MDGITNMTASIILAGGKGTRMQSAQMNKVAIPFHGKPLIQYAVELLSPISSPVVVVVGAYAESVKESLSNYDVLYAVQEEQLGTGHAAQVGVEVLRSHNPKQVLVGYGDHMMFYRQKTIRDFLDEHIKNHATISLMSILHEKPDRLAWGRIVRGGEGQLLDVVEQKDATPKQRRITELNAGFYCFDFQFLLDSIYHIQRSPVTSEYYINNFITIAVAEHKKINVLQVPFTEVGIGINTQDELTLSEQIYKDRSTV